MPTSTCTALIRLADKPVHTTATSVSIHVGSMDGVAVHEVESTVMNTFTSIAFGVNSVLLFGTPTERVEALRTLAHILTTAAADLEGEEAGLVFSEAMWALNEGAV